VRHEQKKQILGYYCGAKLTCLLSVVDCVGSARTTTSLGRNPELKGRGLNAELGRTPAVDGELSNFMHAILQSSLCGQIKPQFSLEKRMCFWSENSLPATHQAALRSTAHCQLIASAENAASNQFKASGSNKHLCNHHPSAAPTSSS
jgi:hypothetical protein